MALTIFYAARRLRASISAVASLGSSVLHVPFSTALYLYTTQGLMGSRQVR